jgi:hypothetical protein
LHGYFCFVVIDERIFANKGCEWWKGRANEFLSWVYVSRKAFFLFFCFFKNKLYVLEIRSFLKRYSMLFLWEECPRRRLCWLWFEV